MRGTRMFQQKQHTGLSVTAPSSMREASGHFRSLRECKHMMLPKAENEPTEHRGSVCSVLAARGVWLLLDCLLNSSYQSYGRKLMTVTHVGMYSYPSPLWNQFLLDHDIWKILWHKMLKM